MSMPSSTTMSKLLLVIAVLTASSYFLGLQSPHRGRRSLHVHNHLQLRAKDLCGGTLYPNLCISTLLSFPGLASQSVPEIISAALNHTSLEVSAASSSCSGIQKERRKLGQQEKQALADCIELFDTTTTELSNAVHELSGDRPVQYYRDLQTLLSAAMTNQYTCLDGFAFSKEKDAIRELFEGNVMNISRHVSNSLAMLRKLPGRPSADVNEAEEFLGYGTVAGGLPSWISPHDRKLLQATVASTPVNLTVAKDGTGNFTTIGEAIAAAPRSSAKRFVIYVKAGAYFENVEVEKKKTNLMLIGDGIGQTLIKGNRNVVDGFTTFRSATFAVVGEGFIAKGITFENYAGPSKHQAVAVRSGADFSAFSNCSFVAFQDTLYVHSLRQFYHNCDIYGTVDFIFGNAAVVFQDCRLYARRPDPNQKNIFTAQGRADPNQNTGISIINCKVAAAADLIPVVSSFKTYLGRPWKEYSRTVYMLSYIESLIDPAGWLEWNGTFALSTLYYGEYNNTGPGSNTTRRVKWPGYRVINSSSEASQFAVGPFIQGNEGLNTPLGYLSIPA